MTQLEETPLKLFFYLNKGNFTDILIKRSRDGPLPSHKAWTSKMLSVERRNKGMNTQLVEQITKSQIRSDLPSFNTGDTIKVALKIVEGGKARIQVFQGVVISRRGHGVGETFIVRKESYGVGVERTLPINSPSIDSITVVKKGKVRRKKVYYLRSRKGKAARLKEVL